MSEILAPPVIALIGLMGSGKSIVGTFLSASLNKEFIDSDDTFEESSRCSIADFFSENGEAAFREREKQIVNNLLSYSNNAVIALGGGCVMEPSTKELIEKLKSDEQLVVVWLDAPVKTLSARVLQTGKERPLLGVDPESTLGELAKMRAETYEQIATVRVETEGVSPEHVAADVLVKLAIKSEE